MPWTNYNQQKPEGAGLYRWRVPSVSCPGLFVQFDCHMRERGAGYSNIISPNFDWWDGYRLHLPPGVQWRAADEGVKCEAYAYANVEAEGIALEACPFCKTIPRIEGTERSGGGWVVGAKPHSYNHWTLKCCRWISSPSFTDPRQLAKVWNSKLAKENPHAP